MYKKASNGFCFLLESPIPLITFHLFDENEKYKGCYLILRRNFYD